MQVLFYDYKVINLRGIIMDILYIACIVILDQITKYIAKLGLMPIEKIDIISGIFELTYVENKGAAFGIFNGKRLILIGFTSIVTGVIIYYLLKNKSLNRYVKISLIMIAAGAIGNLIDRIFLGYVVDFFHLYIKNIFDFPVFNIADISIVFGTFILALNLLLSKE